MSAKKELLVMKFGGSSITSPGSFLRIADIIIERSKCYHKIVIVISAMGNMTNELLDLAKQVHPDPPRREQDMLVSVGERISISLLAMALKGKGKEAISFTGSQSGIITCARHSDARIIDVRPFRLYSKLRENRIVIVAGFQGVGLNGEITTLGRGGSDTSAVALAIALNAEKVEFYKDVSGIYSENPKTNSKAKLFKCMSYEKAHHLCITGSEILHERCISLARKNGMKMHILSHLEFFKNEQIDELGTVIFEEEEKEEGYEPLEGELLKQGACV